jgi:hypothetical protein
VPEITPVVLLMRRPEGNPLAEKVGAGAPIAVTVKAYGAPRRGEGGVALVKVGATPRSTVIGYEAWVAAPLLAIMVAL